MLDKTGDAIESNAAIIADNAAAAIGVWQTCQDVGAATLPYVRSVSVENSIIVGLAILREALDDMRVGRLSICLQRTHNHSKATVRHNGPLERRLSLKTNDDLIVSIDVARNVRRDRAWNLGHIENAFLALFNKQVVQSSPYSFCPFRRGRKERFISVVWLIVLLNEITNVDIFLPETRINPSHGEVVSGAI